MPTNPAQPVQPAARPLVTIVIPAFNEEENLPEVYRRVTAVVASIADCDFEFLVIDNCSQDATEEVVRGFVARDARWRYVRFSRNFGFESSMGASLHYARGDALILLFSDLQDPPELIPTMIKKWREGYDVVYGEIVARSDASFLKTIGAHVAYKLIYWFSEVKIPPNAGDFRLISRPVIDALKRCGEQNRYLRGLVHWVGFRQASFTYERAPRTRGESTMGLIFSFNFAITALVSFSSTPLRWASFLGGLVTLSSVVGTAGYLILVLLYRWGWMSASPPPPGWVTLVLLILFFGGLQSLFLGILGEYLSKIHIEVKHRPLWVLHRTAGFPPGQDPLG